MLKKLTTVALSVVLVAAIAPSAGARRQQIKGSFTASAQPLPGPNGCEGGLDGVHRVSHPLTAPFAGWLKVRATFEDDWHLWLEDPSTGERLASSEYQDYWSKPEERIKYFLEAGQEIAIMLCNWSSRGDAEVSYTLTAGEAWDTPVPKQRITRIEEMPYVSPAVATPDVWVICHSGYDIGCSGISPRPTDRFASVEVIDDVSPSVSFELYEYSGSTYLRSRNFCNEMPEQVPITPGTDWLGVSIYMGPCQDGTPAQGTSGTILLELASK
jgi:hypothetical protein